MVGYKKKKITCLPLTQLNSTEQDIQHTIRVLLDTILRGHLQLRSTLAHTQH